MVIGSGSIVEALAKANLVDEYRLLVFPYSTGSGRRLFGADQRFTLEQVEQVGPAALHILTPDRS